MVRLFRSVTAYLTLNRMKSLRSKTHQDYIREGIKDFKINLVPLDNKIPYGRLVLGLNEKDNSKILENMKGDKFLMGKYDDFDTIIQIAPYFLVPTLAMEYMMHGSGLVLSLYKYGYRKTVDRVISKTTMVDDINSQQLDEEIYEKAKQLKEIIEKQKDTDKYH